MRSHFIAIGCNTLCHLDYNKAYVDNPWRLANHTAYVLRLRSWACRSELVIFLAAKPSQTVLASNTHRHTLQIPSAIRPGLKISSTCVLGVAPSAASDARRPHTRQGGDTGCERDGVPGQVEKGSSTRSGIDATSCSWS